MRQDFEALEIDGKATSSLGLLPSYCPLHISILQVLLNRKSTTHTPEHSPKKRPQQFFFQMLLAIFSMVVIYVFYLTANPVDFWTWKKKDPSFPPHTFPSKPGMLTNVLPAMSSWSTSRSDNAVRKYGHQFTKRLSPWMQGNWGFFWVMISCYFHRTTLKFIKSASLKKQGSTTKNSFIEMDRNRLECSFHHKAEV